MGMPDTLLVTALFAIAVVSAAASRQPLRLCSGVSGGHSGLLQSHGLEE